jgi:hypothetical protein
MALDAVMSVDPSGLELDDFLRQLIFDEPPDEPPIWVQICVVQIGFVKLGKFLLCIVIFLYNPMFTAAKAHLHVFCAH